MLAALVSLGVCVTQHLGVWEVGFPCPDTGPLSKEDDLTSWAWAPLVTVPTLRPRAADEVGEIEVTCTPTEQGVVYAVDVRLTDRDEDFTFATRLPPADYRHYDDSGAWTLVDAMASAGSSGNLQVRILPKDRTRPSVLARVWLSGFRPALERIRDICSTDQRLFDEPTPVR